MIQAHWLLVTGSSIRHPLDCDLIIPNCTFVIDKGLLSFEVLLLIDKWNWGKVMLSCPVCQPGESFCPQKEGLRGSLYIERRHCTPDLCTGSRLAPPCTSKAPASQICLKKQTCSTWSLLYSSPRSDTFKLVHYEAWIVRKRAVGIQLKCLVMIGASTLEVTWVIICISSSYAIPLQHVVLRKPSKIHL